MKLNEKQLRNIISESIKSVLNEIGDTRAGREMLRRAAEKATDLGRPGQAHNFAWGLNNATKDAFGDGATPRTYKYENWKQLPVLIGADGHVRFPGKNGNNGKVYTIEDLFSRDMESELKTSNYNIARKIARWCQENMSATYNPNIYSRLCDWHTWASQ